MPKKAEQEAIKQTIKTLRSVAEQIGYTGERGELARLARVLDERGVETPSGGQWHYGKGGPVGLTRFIKAHMPDGLPVARAESEPVPRETTLSDTLDSETGAHTVPQKTAQAISETAEHENTRAGSYDTSTQKQTPELVLQEHTLAHEIEGETGAHTDSQSTTAVMELESVPQETTASHYPNRELLAHNVIHMDQKDATDLAELLQWWRERRGELDTIQITREERPAFRGPRDTTKTVRLNEAMAKAAEKYARKHKTQTGGNFSAFVELLIWHALGRPEKFVTQENTE